MTRASGAGRIAADADVPEPTDATWAGLDPAARARAGARFLGARPACERRAVALSTPLRTAPPARFEAANDVLRPFVPRIAVDWLRDAPALRARRFEGTLVFADISGFTDLTEALAKRGQEGAEEIAGVVDAAFAELIRARLCPSCRPAEVRRRRHPAALPGREPRAARRLGGGRDAGGPGRHATALDLGRAGPAADVDRRAQRRVPLLPRRRHPPRADHRRRRCDRLRRDRGDRERGRDRSQRRRARGSSTRACWARAATAACCSPHSPVMPETVPPFFDPSGVDLSALLPAAYTRELRGRAERPRAPARGNRVRRAARHRRAARAGRARKRSPRHSRRASRRSRRAVSRSTSRSRRRT